MFDSSDDETIGNHFQPVVGTHSLSDSEESGNSDSPFQRKRNRILNLSDSEDDIPTSQGNDKSGVGRKLIMNLSESEDEEVPNESTIIDFNVQNDEKPAEVENPEENSKKRKLSEETVNEDKRQKRQKKFNNIYSNRVSLESDSYKDLSIFDDSDDEGDSRRKNNSKNLTIKQNVVDFIDTASSNELICCRHMSDKKIQLIIENRPFKTWLNMAQQFKLLKGLTTATLEGVYEYLTAKDLIKVLLIKCESIAKQIENEVISTQVAQPSLLNPEMKLADHQLVGLNWLAMMRKNHLNTILADEMGLGKTIQVIALLAYLKENGLTCDGCPHLIVVPSSTLENWAEEIEKWCPSLKVAIYHGHIMERKSWRSHWYKHGFGDIDVILTTYSCASGQPEEKKMFRVKEFNYIVFDEAHKLKNMTSTVYESLVSFNGNYKLLLTGTPLQNNLLELMSLMVFLLPSLFADTIDSVKLLFSRSAKTTGEQCSSLEGERVKQAKCILEPFILRRLKTDVLKTLPLKTTEVMRCPMIEYQKAKYKEIMEEFQHDSQLADNNCYQTYFVLLRKMANHPLLVRYRFTQDMLRKMSVILADDPSYKGQNADYIAEELYFLSDFELHSLCINMDSLRDLNYSIEDEYYLKSGKFNVLTPLLDDLKVDGHRVLIFTQFTLMLDVFEEYCRIRNFTYLRLDGSTQTEDRQELIHSFNSNPEIFIFLLSTKAGGQGINLTSADTVIINDMDYNPYNDKQAEDRCHRFGQTKPVRIIKLVSEGTVEEGIQRVAEAKLSLGQEVIAANNDDKAETKTIQQLLKENLKEVLSIS